MPWALVNAELNSMHLDAGRLNQYRQAREKLLHACGQQTLHISGEALEDQIRKLREIAMPHSSGSRKLKLEPQQPFVTLNSHQKIDLKLGHNSIGRLPDNDIVACDGFMSRRHCAILVHTDMRCELHDLASKNGTFLNGIRINGPTPLHPGDEVKLGDIRIRFMGEVAKDSRSGHDHTCILPDSKVA